jgi:hypothetical protein
LSFYKSDRFWYWVNKEHGDSVVIQQKNNNKIKIKIETLYCEIQSPLIINLWILIQHLFLSGLNGASSPFLFVLMKDSQRAITSGYTYHAACHCAFLAVNARTLIAFQITSIFGIVLVFLYLL